MCQQHNDETLMRRAMTKTRQTVNKCHCQARLTSGGNRAITKTFTNIPEELVFLVWSCTPAPLTSRYQSLCFSFYRARVWMVELVKSQTVSHFTWSHHVTSYHKRTARTYRELRATSVGCLRRRGSAQCTRTTPRGSARLLLIWPTLDRCLLPVKGCCLKTPSFLRVSARPHLHTIFTTGRLRLTLRFLMLFTERPSFSHVTSGRGIPLAVHLNSYLSPSTTVCSTPFCVG